MALKSKIKQLEDIVANDTESQLITEKFSEKAPTTPALVATQADLEEPDVEQIQELDMVHVGSIEEVAKQEIREARRQSSLHRGPYPEHQRRGRGDYGYYDRRGYWNNNHRGSGRNASYSRRGEYSQEAFHSQNDSRSGYRGNFNGRRRREQD